MTSKLNLNAVLDAAPALWSPQVVGAVNDYDIKAANVGGEYIEHVHADTDEIFIVLSGRLHLDLPDETVTLDPFDVYTVARGVPHRPRAEDGTRIMMVEPRGTTQNGAVDGNTGTRLTA